MVNGRDFSTSGTLGPELVGRLYDRHAAALELYARQWCDCSEDVVQEALIELVVQSKAPDDAAAWLYRVVRNKAISASRSAQRRRHHEAQAADRRPRWFERSAADLIDAGVDATALQSLSLEHREVVVARIWGRLSFQEISELVGVSQSAAHRRYEAALLALRQKLRVSCLKND
jgi:RNA polymerase sigma factor (sigma-70 family)